MKKFILLTLCCISLLFLNAPFRLSTLSQEFDGTHSFYASKDCKATNLTSTKNGAGYILSAKTKNASLVQDCLDNNFVAGESFCFDGDEKDIKYILKRLSATIKRKEVFDEFELFYAYSPKFYSYITIDNKKINVQIAKNKNTITVGTPIIFGSY